MLTPEQTESLNKQFTVRYGKFFAALNKNVYPAALNDNKAYEVPVVELYPGGMLVCPKDDAPFELPVPGKARVSLQYRKQEVVIYRLAIPATELTIAADRPEYFNYLMDSILNPAIVNYRKAYGDENILRFGQTYCSYQFPNGDIFRGIDDDNIEIRLFGAWAGQEGVTA